LEQLDHPNVVEHMVEVVVAMFQHVQEVHKVQLTFASHMVVVAVVKIQSAQMELNPILIFV
jgi:flagellar biosynthesis protein FliQ